MPNKVTRYNVNVVISHHQIKENNHDRILFWLSDVTANNHLTLKKLVKVSVTHSEFVFRVIHYYLCLVTVYFTVAYISELDSIK